MIALADVAVLLVILAIFWSLFAIAGLFIETLGHHYQPPGYRIATDPMFGDCQSCGGQGVRIHQHRHHPVLDIELLCDSCMTTEVTA